MMKNAIRKFVALAAVAMVFVVSATAGDYQIEFQPKVFEQAVKIEHKGVLKQKENGYLYLEVPNTFISEILPLIDAPGTIVPPRHYSSKKGIGAHISVMYENEQIENEIWEIEELGNEYTFAVLELRTVKLNQNNKMRKLWLLAVDAPALEQLRERYGLSPKLKGHDFHITIGTQIPGKVNVEEEEDAA
jgi:hypothetical protein